MPAEINQLNERFSRTTPQASGAVAHLVNCAYRPEGDSAQGWTHESDFVSGSRITPAQVEQILCRPQNRIYLAHQDDKLVGSIQATLLDGSIELGMFAVDPARQNTGIGSRLMAYAEQTAGKEACATTAQIYVVHTQKMLIQFYERRGYRKTLRVEPYPVDANAGTPKGIELHLVHMVKRLQF